MQKVPSLENTVLKHLLMRIYLNPITVHGRIARKQGTKLEISCTCDFSLL